MSRGNSKNNNNSSDAFSVMDHLLGLVTTLAVLGGIGFAAYYMFAMGGLEKLNSMVAAHQYQPGFQQ